MDIELFNESDLPDIIGELTSQEYETLDPLPRFRKLMGQFPGVLNEDPGFDDPLYPDFDNFDLKHDTSKIEPIYLNDFNFKLEEDKERIVELIRMDFDSDTFETIAQCNCGKYKGNYWIGSGKVCEKCGYSVERLLDSSLETKLWLRLPEGANTFINPLYYKTFFSRIATTAPKIEIITFMIDSSYRKTIKRNNPSRVKLVNELEALGVGLGLNSFHANADAILHHFLIGEGRKFTSLSVAMGITYFQFYLDNKEKVFCKYLSIPNKICNIIEKDGDNCYGDKDQLEISQIYQAMGDTKSSTNYYKPTASDLKETEDVVGKSIVKLSQKQSTSNKDLLFNKKSLFRKHVFGGSIPLTGRSVITSVTGIHNPNCLRVPWVMALAILEVHITSYLYRLGYTPKKVQRKIREAANKLDPEIDTFFKVMEQTKSCMVICGRHPSIQYLSAKAYYLTINRDLRDLSINLPILAISEKGADFDGRRLPSLNFSNCWEPLKLI